MTASWGWECRPHCTPTHISLLLLATQSFLEAVGWAHYGWPVVASQLPPGSSPLTPRSLQWDQGQGSRFCTWPSSRFCIGWSHRRFCWVEMEPSRCRGLFSVLLSQMLWLWLLSPAPIGRNGLPSSPAPILAYVTPHLPEAQGLQLCSSWLSLLFPTSERLLSRGNVGTEQTLL